MLTLSSQAAGWFAVFALPVCLWVAWSDMAFMKIPNKAVIALVAIYAVIGVLVLPLETWAIRWLNLAVMLAIGFALNQGGAMGAGDAKFIAAAAPFVPVQDAAALMTVFAALLLAAFATHRMVRAMPVIRRLTPGWRSWQVRKFPMGLALGPALAFYLVLAAIG